MYHKFTLPTWKVSKELWEWKINNYDKLYPWDNRFVLESSLHEILSIYGKLLFLESSQIGKTLF